jgi:hypothetical protein
MRKAPFVPLTGLSFLLNAPVPRRRAARQPPENDAMMTA